MRMNLDEYFRFDHEVYLYGVLFLEKQTRYYVTYRLFSTKEH